MNSRKEQLKAAMTATREKTLWLFAQVPDEFLKKRVHSFYSPIGWHFGHIARTEEYWIICKALGRPCLDEHYTFLFADLPENPKDERVHLPTRAEIVEYLARVRQATFDALDSANLDSEDPFLTDGYGWEFALQHESQHQETICEMLQLIQKASGIDRDLCRFSKMNPSGRQPEMVKIPGGAFLMGSDARHGYDNEKTAHPVTIDPFELARTPVTAGQWLAFIEEGGYSTESLWSPEGWRWRSKEDATKPEYWVESQSVYAYHGPFGLRDIHPAEPVSCVSWFEADAFARWAGMRLPTEEEWEYAARGSIEPDATLGVVLSKTFERPANSTFGSPRNGWSGKSGSKLPHSKELRSNSERNSQEGRLLADGNLNPIYPWGNACPKGRATFGMNSWGPEPVGSYPEGASPFGLLDMAGNVWEWTSTPFLPYPGFQAFPYDGYSKDHMEGHHKVCRGGSWATSARILRCSFRNWYVPTYRQGFLGLRLAR